MLFKGNTQPLDLTSEHGLVFGGANHGEEHQVDRRVPLGHLSEQSTLAPPLQSQSMHVGLSVVAATHSPCAPHDMPAGQGVASAPAQVARRDQSVSPFHTAISLGAAPGNSNPSTNNTNRPKTGIAHEEGCVVMVSEPKRAPIL